MSVLISMSLRIGSGKGICNEETPPSHAGFILSQECPGVTQSALSLSSACVSSDKRKLSDKNGQLFREVFVL